MDRIHNIFKKTRSSNVETGFINHYGRGRYKRLKTNVLEEDFLGPFLENGHLYIPCLNRPDYGDLYLFGLPVDNTPEENIRIIKNVWCHADLYFKRCMVDIFKFYNPKEPV